MQKGNCEQYERSNAAGSSPNGRSNLLWTVIHNKILGQIVGETLEARPSDVLVLPESIKTMSDNNAIRLYVCATGVSSRGIPQMVCGRQGHHRRHASFRA